jgi:hypothetical protein
VPVAIPETRADRTRQRRRRRLAASAGGLFLIIGIAYVGTHNDVLVTLLTRIGS